MVERCLYRKIVKVECQSITLSGDLVSYLYPSM